MKNSIKKAVATALFALTNVAVFAAGNNSTVSSSSLSSVAVVGFFAVLIGAIVVPALGHKAHH